MPTYWKLKPIGSAAETAPSTWIVETPVPPVKDVNVPVDGVKIYVDATGKPQSEIENLMKNETWFSAEEYKNMGFVTEII